MSEQFTPKKVVLASHNEGKLQEMLRLLSPLGMTLHLQTEFGVSDIEETGLTFIENAILKARHASELTGLTAIADDSGLCVDALDGAPGIFSARFAGHARSSHENNQKLIKALAGNLNRRAFFSCTIVYLKHARDPSPIIGQGHWEGSITDVAQGKNGFGYDPYFFVPGQDKTAAQLSSFDKDRLSHRGQAVRQLMQALKNV